MMNLSLGKCDGGGGNNNVILINVFGDDDDALAVGGGGEGRTGGAADEDEYGPTNRASRDGPLRRIDGRLKPGGSGATA